MDAKRFKKFINVLQILSKSKKEQDITNECHNKSLNEDNVQVYVGGTQFVNIDLNFMNN